MLICLLRSALALAASIAVTSCMHANATTAESSWRGTGGATTISAVRTSDSVVDAIGVDSHLGYTNTVYGSKAVRELLCMSGIRHVRDAQGYVVGKCGIRHGIGLDYRMNLAAIQTLVSSADKYTEFVEPQNELDSYEHNSHNPAMSVPKWEAVLRQQQQWLWQVGHGKYTILGPALANNGKYSRIGDLSPYMDAGNEHDGACSDKPEVSSTAQHLALTRVTNGDRPVWTTETGYSDGDLGGYTGLSSHPFVNRCYIDDYSEAIYVPRALAYRLLLGERRVYFYQFSDYPPDPMFGHMGLSTKGVPKPPLLALESLIRLLTDKGPAFTPLDQHVALRGNVLHMTTAKRDGTTIVLVWQPTSIWIGKPIYERTTVSDVPVTITSSSKAKTATVYRYDTNTWSLIPTTMAMTRGEVSLNVGASITYVAFR